MNSAKNLNQNRDSDESVKEQKVRRKKKRKFVADFNIPGVYKVALPDTVQQFIQCVVGETVTVEKPWTYVEKEALQEHIEYHSEESPFYPMRLALETFPEKEVFLGYIPDESKEYNEFYVCVTIEATNTVIETADKIKRLQEARLKNAIVRRVKRWKSLGSEKEVEAEMLKTNRPLIEVEIESRFPIFLNDFKFRQVKAENLGHGCLEMKCVDEASSAIFKRRNSIGLQVTPKTDNREAQTVYTFPKNSVTQYEYIASDVQGEDTEKSLAIFFSTTADSICNILNVNSRINFYANDYLDLVVKREDFSLKDFHTTTGEYKGFVNMNLCGGKMISSISWHEMWSGCAVLSYIDVAPGIYISTKSKTNSIYKSVFDTNPVLFWSFDDDLQPKLILETPRPVYTVSCCPYNPNLVIGGCVNGQIIIWDVTNKLNSVEEEEVLTIDQQKYRDYMSFLMQWMKNTFDKAKVRPTAISDLKFSHQGCVTSISWMSPFHNVTKVGEIEEVEEGSQSLQVVTAAEDGTVLIWDLLKHPVKVPGGFKGMRKAKRLQKRPSVLVEMESSFKSLHLLLKPIYKINLYSTLHKRKMNISSCCVDFFAPMYNSSTSTKTTLLSSRVIYTPDFKIQYTNRRKIFYLGTVEGDYMQCAWEGQKFDSGEVVNFEDARFINVGRFHDGPIVSIDYARVHDTILTVGGKIFALWRESFKGRPIFWRKGTCTYTCGSWLHFEKSAFRLARMDGYHEYWMIFLKSNAPTNLKLMSNGPISHLTTHPRKIKKTVFGLCDCRGVLRMFYGQQANLLVARAQEEYMSSFLTNELQRKKKFLAWQEKWNRRHFDPSFVTGEKSTVKITTFEELSKKEDKKKHAKVSAGIRYLESVQEQQKKTMEANIKKIILLKKQLNTEELLAQREPLRKLEEEIEEKKRKQKNRVKESETIFKQQVEMLFPHFVKSKRERPSDPYKSSFDDNEMKANLSDYLKTEEKSRNFVEENPFNLDFSWKKNLRVGVERRKKFDSLLKYGHRKRFDAEKQKQKKMSEQLNTFTDRKSTSSKSDSQSEFSIP